MRKQKKGKAGLALILCLAVAILIEIFFKFGIQFLSEQSETVGNQFSYYDALFVHVIILFPICVATIGFSIHLILKREKVGLSLFGLILVLMIAFTNPFVHSVGKKEVDYHSLSATHQNKTQGQPRVKASGRKGKHYNILLKEFQKPQTVVEVNGFEIQLNNHLRVKAFGIHESIDNKHEFERWVTERFLFQKVYLGLPSWEDFQRNYFLESRINTGSGSDTYSHWGEKITQFVPVLIYIRENETLNEQFR